MVDIGKSVYIFFQALVLWFQVTGISITFNRDPLDISSGNDLDFIITCGIDESMKTLITLTLKREDTAGNYVSLGNIFPPRDPAVLVLDVFPADLRNRGANISGAYDSNNPQTARLTMTMKVGVMQCSDGRGYQCQLVYMDSNNNVKTVQDQKNLTVNVQPEDTITMTARNVSSGFEIPLNGGIGTQSNPAVFYEGQMVELTCQARIGSDPNTVIRWSKSDMYGQLINFNPVLKDDGTPEDVGNCQYQRTAKVTYNMTVMDASRDTTSRLWFECYVDTGSYSTPDDSRPEFYVYVYNENSGNQGASTGDGDGGTSQAGVIAGAVIGSLAFIVLIVLAVYFLWYRRREGKDYQTKEEQGASNPNLAPTYAVPEKRRGSNDDLDAKRPKPKPRPNKDQQNLHYAELDLMENPPKAPRRSKPSTEPVEYAEVEFQSNSHAV